MRKALANARPRRHKFNRPNAKTRRRKVAEKKISVLRCCRWNCRKRITVYNVRPGVFDSAVSPHPLPAPACRAVGRPRARQAGVPLPGGEGDPFASAPSGQELRFHHAPPAMFPSPWGRGIKGEGKRCQRIRRVSVVKQRADRCSLPRLYALETSRNQNFLLPAASFIFAALRLCGLALKFPAPAWTFASVLECASPLALWQC